MFSKFINKLSVKLYDWVEWYRDGMPAKGTELTPAQLKAKWVRALRSGRYSQTTGKLRDPETNGFCCLGVLADVKDPNGWGCVDGDAQEHRLKDEEEEILDREKVLFNKVPAHPNRYRVDWEDAQERLARMNDDGADFEEIADFIEKHVEILQ